MRHLNISFSSKKFCFSVLLAALFLAGCNKGEKFPALGDKISSPTDVAVSDSGDYFFVLNADFDRTYNTGSILTMKPDGTKVATLQVPRLGRSMSVAGNDMLVTFDRAQDDETRKLTLYDITDPAAPQSKISWDLDCAAWNTVIRKGYKYFAVNCLDGKLFIGTLADKREESTLKLVRQYATGGGWTRRAMHIDTKRNLLFMFTTVIRYKDFLINDLEDDDRYSFDETTNSQVDAPDGDEVPDALQKDAATNRREMTNRQKWQFVVYNIAKEAAVPAADCGLEECGPFPYRSADISITNKDQTVKNEFRWLYFTATNRYGYPDSDAGYWNQNRQIYRTNIWEAKPDPLNADAFYISQRGAKASPYSNHVVRVTITGDIAATSPVLRTKDVLRFERVYGFGGELNADGRHYPGDFEVVSINGAPTLLVNHFKDLSGFVRADAYSSLVSKVLDEGDWVSELTGTDASESFYQVAVNSKGQGISGSYYGNAVILLDIQPGIGINKTQRIE